MLRTELPGKRKRGRPKRRFMDAVREDTAVVEVMEEDAGNRNKWRCKIRCCAPLVGEAKRRSLTTRLIAMHALIVIYLESATASWVVTPFPEKSSW